MSHEIIWFIGFVFIVNIFLWMATKNHRACVTIVAVSTAVGIAIALAGAFGAMVGATSDIEIINGKITEKTRVHGTYEESYECGCKTDSKGARSCNTCYRTHYTVEWTAKSTVGDFRIDYLDDTSRRVYLTADPSDFTKIVIGEAASAQHRYTNYVQAVPNSLFTQTSKDVLEKLKAHIPAYPDRIYNRWKNDHVVSADLQISDLAEWNALVSDHLRDVGPAKQVNLIFVVTKTSDPNIEYALRDSWENGNKNDVIVIVGAPEYPKIEFARVVTWSKNELFKIELKDAVEAYGRADKGLTEISIAQINKNFERRKMKEFAYLQNEIGVPLWVTILVLSLIVAVTFTIYFKRYSF